MIEILHKDGGRVILSLEIVQAFEKLCEELGFIRDDEDNPLGDDW